ncbi:MAG: hypothetical protein PHD61_11235 [Bacteroidales bacterium]|nr:hypothetical protein [Lentimicrobiaceae bacterium]MDD5695861.1 hypothetical protein [Bacteroidales bacterium]
MRRFHILVLPLILVGLMARADGWELVKDKDGIKIYTRSTENSKFKTYRGEAITNIGMNEMYRILIDLDNYDQWVYSNSESRLLSETGNGEYTYYSVMSLPFPFDNRDMTTVMKVSMGQDTIRFVTSLVKGKPSPKGIVPIAAYEEITTLVKLGEKQVKMIMEGYFEPGGTLPAWVINMFLSEGPYQSLMTLKKLHEK